MEFMTGVNKKETLEIGDLLTGSYEGKSVKVNGAVHTIRDMGEVAFIVLRKREGLLQCVYEEGKTQFDLKDLKEAATIEVEGTVKPEERAPHGFEIRLDKINLKMEIKYLLGGEFKQPCDRPSKYQGACKIPYSGRCGTGIS